MFEDILITIATAATPLLIAAIGELVVERSGVLNLGVEGMMIMGAVTGFGVAWTTGSPWLGVLPRSRSASCSAAVRLPDPDAGDQPGRDRTGTDAAGARPFRHDRRELCRAAGRQADGHLHPGPDGHPVCRQALLRPGSAVLRLGRPRRSRVLLPVLLEGGANAALGRRQSRLRACAGHQGDRHPLSGGDVRAPARALPAPIFRWSTCRNGSRTCRRGAAGSRWRWSCSPRGGPGGCLPAPISSARCRSASSTRRRWG